MNHFWSYAALGMILFGTILQLLTILQLMNNTLDAIYYTTLGFGIYIAEKIK